MEKRKKREKIQKKKGEEVCEIFEVEKNGKEETIQTCGIEEEKPVSPEQIKKENKIFRNIILMMIGLLVILAAILLISYWNNKFKVGLVTFEIDMKNIAGKTIYKTSIPVHKKDSVTGKTISNVYNFYLRNDPRELDKLQFDGAIKVKTNMVINMTQNFSCDGDGVIGLANLVNLYKLLGTSVIKDENASCDSIGRYMYLNIQEGNETRVEQYGPACLNIYIKDCEILKGTERFMLETLKEVNRRI